MSSGRYASSEPDFSATAGSATTGCGGRTVVAMACIAPSTAHPPSLSRFIPTMPLLIFSESPPESYVMVLPISTAGLPDADRDGLYSSRISHGLFSNALPTLISPSNRSLTRAQPEHKRPDPHASRAHYH